MESLLNDEFGAVQANHSSSPRFRYTTATRRTNKYEQPHESSNADVVAAVGYASDDGACSHRSPWNRERNRGVPWTEEEHKLFLLGLRKAGMGDWRGIARNFVKTRTPTQVAAHAHKYLQRSKENLRVALSIRKLPFSQGIRPSDYTGPEEIEATGFQICAEELVSSPRKSINLEVVENVSLEVKSDYTGPEELEATGFQICAEELVSSPRKGKFFEVVENSYLEVKSAYTEPREVEATGFQICSNELVSSPRKCRFLEVVDDVSMEIKGCCCAFFEDLMCAY